MHKYQKTTRYHSGAVRVTIDQDVTTVTRLSRDHPTKSVICTNAQGREVAHFILEGLGRSGGSDITEGKIIPVSQHLPLHVYRVLSEWGAEGIYMMAQGLLDIAGYVEANRTQLEREAREDAELGQRSDVDEW